MPESISVTILTKNSEKHIARCLMALSTFPEVILLDNGSTDNTVTIASGFSNVLIRHTPFLGFGHLKNLAASYATHNWILSVDSDEVLSPELVIQITTQNLQPGTVYRFLRLNHYGKRLINACGWKNDYVFRLYNRQTTAFTPKEVHESIIRDGLTTKTITGTMAHYSFENTGELLQKLNQYTTLFARENRIKRKSSVFKALYKAAWTFIRNYFLQRGFQYGFEGFLISACNANGALYKYLKLHEANRRITTSLIITTYNWPQALEMVLESVRTQTELPDEVIIADDGSGADTIALIATFKDKFPVPLYHSWQEDQGFRAAQSRNKAMAISGGEYIIIVDGDMMLHPDFIKSHKRTAAANTFIHGKRVLLQPELTKQILQRKQYQINFFTGGIINRFNTISSDFLSSLFSRKQQNIKAVRSCNMAFWRTDMLRINGFNNEFVGWGREDSEFALRLLNAGVKRKNLVFGGVGYHLYHDEKPRTALPENDKILLDAIKQKTTWCPNGINQFIKEKH